jgi:tetratricopeptide (TPR) repeat protein
MVISLFGRREIMAKKKTTHLSVSQEEMVQVQRVCQQCQQIADNLYASKNQQQVEAALADVNTLSEQAQIVLLKELAKEDQVAAADVLAAINQLSTLKSVRKEARRSLIRLEGAKIYPQWEAPKADVEETEEKSEKHGLDPQAVLTRFMKYWSLRDFGRAYDLLSQQSHVREDLSREEWIERRWAWAAAAHPGDLESTFFCEHNPSKSHPVTGRDTVSHKTFEAGWSLRLDKTPSIGTLPELPQASAIYAKTRRHWFWASYTLVREDDDWRIDTMTDESTKAQDLSIEELQAKIDELEARANEITVKSHLGTGRKLSTQETMNALQELFTPILQTTYYSDILMKKSPSDRSVYEEALRRMSTIGRHERFYTYLIPFAQQFPREQGPWLRRIAEVQLQLSKGLLRTDNTKDTDDTFNEEYARYLEDLAEESLRESLVAEDSFDAHWSLAGIMMRRELFDEAEEYLLQAKEFVDTTDPEQQADVERSLGEIATRLERFEDALFHYQQVVQILPNSGKGWFRLAQTQDALAYTDEAEASYKRAIECQPDETDYYDTLSDFYATHDQPLKAKQALEDGLAANPDSTTMNLHLVEFHMGQEDYQQAAIYMRQAERLEPYSKTVRSFRSALNGMSKLKRSSSANKGAFSFKQRRRN